ncbi:GTP-binding protein [Chitinophaga sp. LS1]|uniref:CobW family GTP-binding protein n=1 Tax=Chitinophaga sp. LS1 TaxID=3051176 RepID=UPI002AAAC181|nr:GTP-binding protein [Chitinophaga sp. LS1]WPV64591.1 GTP-binding protein [Chitinophaga sp. LS1]
MKQIQPKPVTIITGFLGAGKTTFLNELLIAEKRGKYAIIENEFGKESIDGELVMDISDNIFEMSSGCLCCNLNEDLVALLIDLSNKASAFEELIIETTGIADPSSVALPFLIDPVVTRYYQLQRVICLVDARNISYELATTEEARKQISFSDILLISKTDLVSDEELAGIHNLLKEINPFAIILSGTKDHFPHKEMMDYIRKQNEHYNGQETKTEKHHHSLSSLTLTFDKPFDIPKLQHTMMVFMAVQAKDIYRVKGIVYGFGENEKYILQSVAEYLAMAPGNQWQEGEIRRSKIVFIGKNLKMKGFEQLLSHALY